MECNVGRTERIVRIAAGLAILGAGAYLGTYWGLLGFLPILTAVIGWCPVNALLKLSTCKDPDSTLPDTSAEEGRHHPLNPPPDRKDKQSRPKF
jgi:hypothetical protein